MKAIVLTSYGPPDTLQLRDVPKPSPGKGEVLVKVITSTVTLGDCEIRSLTLPRWTRTPLRLIKGWNRLRKNTGTGMEVAGIVEEIGAGVTTLKVGDAVFGSTGMKMGGNAEYVVRPAKTLAIKPAGVSYQDVVTIPVGGINALHFLSKANIQPGQKLLIIGAGGSIGTYGVQLAKMYGAEVTAVDHGSKLNLLKSIGADHVIDYTKEDYASAGQKYDVIFDVIYSSPFDKCIASLKTSGIYLMANTDPARMIRASFLKNPRTFFQLASEMPSDLAYIASLISEGKIKPVIDRTYSLGQVPEAHAYVESGAKMGCVVIKHVLD